MARRNPGEGSSPSYLVRAGWNVAIVLAGLAAFVGTGPGYHATIQLVFDFALDQYGDLVATLVIWVWWAVVAVLLFLLSLMTIVLTFVIAVFAVGRWLE